MEKAKPRVFTDISLAGGNALQCPQNRHGPHGESPAEPQRAGVKNRSGSSGDSAFELASFASPVVISSSWFAEISAHVFNRPYRNFIPAPSKGIQPP